MSCNKFIVSLHYQKSLSDEDDRIDSILFFQEKEKGKEFSSKDVLTNVKYNIYPSIFHKACL